MSKAPKSVSRTEHSRKKWAMWVSDQRPLPCEGCLTDFGTIPVFAKVLQNLVFE